MPGKGYNFEQSGVAVVSFRGGIRRDAGKSAVNQQKKKKAEDAHCIPPCMIAASIAAKKLRDNGGQSWLQRRAF